VLFALYFILDKCKKKNGAYTRKIGRILMGKRKGICADRVEYKFKEKMVG